MQLRKSIQVSIITQTKLLKWNDSLVNGLTKDYELCQAMTNLRPDVMTNGKQQEFSSTKSFEVIRLQKPLESFQSQAAVMQN